MKFIIKLFPEITIKSPSVRLRFIKILSTNIRNLLKRLDGSVIVTRHWDYIEVFTPHENHGASLGEALTCIPGIAQILDVEEHYFSDMHHIIEPALKAWCHLLAEKTFCVRVKRAGVHAFRSTDVERYLGSALQQHVPSARVNLTCPQIVLNLEICHNRLILVKARYQGLGGFPVGTQDDVLSLISGGFDSAVSSYMLLRRGCRVHYCFFNLGGSAHEAGVKQLVDYLWHRFGRSHPIYFVAINFAPVLAEIKKKITDGQMGVILKRMMVRAASQIAERYGIPAMVTGEALGQVSSQTLTNLGLIDSVSDTLILRPLISHDKQHIIQLAREIGTESFSKAMPEYCGVISQKPTVKAVKSRIEAEEACFDFSILQQVIDTAKSTDIRKIIVTDRSDVTEIQVLTEPGIDDILLDIRTPHEQQDNPLMLENTEVRLVPFYKLDTDFSLLDQSRTYLLYCAQGRMSYLQAQYLYEQGYTNVKVYRP